MSMKDEWGNALSGADATARDLFGQALQQFRCRARTTAQVKNRPCASGFFRPCFGYRLGDVRIGHDIGQSREQTGAARLRSGVRNWLCCRNGQPRYLLPW